MDATAVHRALSEPSRARLLAALRGADRALSVAELAAAVGLHATTVRSHLAILAEAGLVSAAPEPRAGAGRPRLLYRAEGEGEQAEAGGYRLLARVLASHLEGTSDDPAAEALRAGEAWGAYLVERPAPYTRVTAEDARTAVIDHLDGLGFDPEPVGEDGTVRLRRCPFLDTARAHQTVVCAIHLGLMRGMLATLGAPLEATELTPFAEPAACRTRLAAPA